MPGPSRSKLDAGARSHGDAQSVGSLLGAVLSRRQRRAIWILCAAVITCAVVLGTEWYRWTTPRVLHAGTVAVAVDRHDLSVGPVAGEGLFGTLGLVGGRCVGFVDPGSDGRDVVLVWPAGTSIGGEGSRLVIHSQGKVFRLGDRIEGGTEGGTRFPGLEGKLPNACRRAGLVDFEPSS